MEEPRTSIFDDPKLSFAVGVATAATWLSNLTYRTDHPRPSYAERRARGERVRCIYAAWHCQLWHCMHFMRRQGTAVLVSQHRDGEIIARTLAHLGYDPIRGSSTRGGGGALRDLLRHARDAESDIVITMDGPRGPARRVKDGVLYTASRTGLPLVPLGLWVDRAWTAKSWDRTIVGKPFTRAVIYAGDEIEVPARADRDVIAEYRGRVEQAMADAERIADEFGRAGGRHRVSTSRGVSA